MYMTDKIRLYADGALGIGHGFFDEIPLGFGMKLGETVSLGVSYTMPYSVLFPLLDVHYYSYKVFASGTACPIKFTVRYSIPLRRSQ